MLSSNCILPHHRESMQLSSPNRVTYSKIRHSLMKIRYVRVSLFLSLFAWCLSYYPILHGKRLFSLFSNCFSCTCSDACMFVGVLSMLRVNALNALSSLCSIMNAGIQVQMYKGYSFYRRRVSSQWLWQLSITPLKARKMTQVWKMTCCSLWTR